MLSLPLCRVVGLFRYHMCPRKGDWQSDRVSPTLETGLLSVFMQVTVTLPYRLNICSCDVSVRHVAPENRVK